MSLHSETTGLSILIPAYQIDIERLISGLVQQQHRWPALEIIVFDDCSPDEAIKSKNRILLEKNPDIQYVELNANVGRSQIRNLMARKAIYSHLLLLDADSFIHNPDFLEKYLQLYDKQVVYGGTCYPNKPESRELMLHYWVGLHREAHKASFRQRDPYRYFTLNNVMVQRSLILDMPLYDQLKSYGHEDTLWVQQLEAKQVLVEHLDNPVEHTGLEPVEQFLKKSKQAVSNLELLSSLGLLLKETPLLKLWKNKRVPWLTLVVDSLLNGVVGLIRKQLMRYHRPLFLFDLYKLLCLEQAYRARK